jgi:hypothetical protein
VDRQALGTAAAQVGIFGHRVRGLEEVSGDGAAVVLAEGAVPPSVTARTGRLVLAPRGQAGVHPRGVDFPTPRREIVELLGAREPGLPGPGI